MALKNFTQLALTSAVAAADPAGAPDGDAAGDDTVAEADVAAADAVVEGGADEEELELLLEQADIAATSSSPEAGARQIRRAVGLNRIVTLLGLAWRAGYR